jgi:hypothetical protein
VNIRSAALAMGALKCMMIDSMGVGSVDVRGWDDAGYSAVQRRSALWRHLASERLSRSWLSP